MWTKCIRAVPSWHGGHGRRDCVFIKNDSSPSSPRNLRDVGVARVYLFFSFTYHEVVYSCALVHHLQFVGDKPDEDTGMWIVKRPRHSDARAQVIQLSTIYRAAHLIPVYAGAAKISKKFSPANSLDKFRFYYVNKFADYDTFKFAHL